MKKETLWAIVHCEKAIWHEGNEAIEKENSPLRRGEVDSVVEHSETYSVGRGCVPVRGKAKKMLKQVQHDNTINSSLTRERLASRGREQSGVLFNASRSREVRWVPSRRGKVAFTLAEVLITLGIIGIVAAMTIPGLITKLNDKLMHHHKEVMLTRLAEGFNMFSNQENGLNMEYANTKQFVQGLSKHMKIMQICGPENMADCFPFKKISYEKNGELEEVEISSLTTAKKIGLEADGFLDPAGFVMANGTSVILSWNNNCGSLTDDKGNHYVDPDKPLSIKNLPLGICIDGLYDIKPKGAIATFNKDVQPFFAASVGGADCLLKVNNKCLISTPAVVPTPMTKADCESNKSTLGINGCHYNTDYWAGAMKMCHDQGMRLPTEVELAQLATYLYNTQVGTTVSISDVTLNTTIIPEALSGIGSSWYSLWSSGEYSDRSIYRRGFGPSASGFDTGSRDLNGVKAICIADK